MGWEHPKKIDFFGFFDSANLPKQSEGCLVNTTGFLTPMSNDQLFESIIFSFERTSVFLGTTGQKTINQLKVNSEVMDGDFSQSQYFGDICQGQKVVGNMC